MDDGLMAGNVEKDGAHTGRARTGPPLASPGRLVANAASRRCCAAGYAEWVVAEEATEVAAADPSSAVGTARTYLPGQRL
jgi:hypothetical protein